MNPYDPNQPEVGIEDKPDPGVRNPLLLIALAVAIPCCAVGGLFLWHRQLNPSYIPGFEMSMIDKERFDQVCMVTGVAVLVSELLIISRILKARRSVK